MDDTTIDGVLAYMAFRIVESRRRDLRETIAIRIFKRDGTVSAEQVDEGFAAEWVEPDAQEVADIVARKARAAVEWHNDEAARIEAGADNQDAKAAHLVAQAEAAIEAGNNTRAEAESLRADGETARLLLAAAEAAGGDAGRAPGGMDAEAKAAVAEAVGVAGTPNGGN